MKNTAKIKIPEGYRILRPLEKIRAGDLCKWHLRSGSDLKLDYFGTGDEGRRVKKDRYKDFYIRRVE